MRLTRESLRYAGERGGEMVDSSVVSGATDAGVDMEDGAAAKAANGPGWKRGVKS